MAHFSNAELAQKLSDLVLYWSTFNEEYANWLGGEVDGGPGADGNYTVTAYDGTEQLIACPAKLADNVSGYVGDASGFADAAEASAAAALISEDAAAASAVTATAQAVLADADRIAAEAAESGAIDAKVVAIAQAAVATAKAVLTAADVVLTNADVVLTAADVIAAAASAAAALASEIAAAASAASIDIDLIGYLAENEVVTGLWSFTNAGITAFTGNVTAPNLNVSNWDTAYGWGDHASGGYLTSETSHADVVVDGDFASNGILKRTAAGVYGIITDASANWNTAYGWGDHAGLYSASAHSHGDINITDGVDHLAFSATAGIASLQPMGGLTSLDINVNVTANAIAAAGAVTGSNLNVSNWDTAYSWGDWSGEGFLTGVAVSDLDNGTDGELITWSAAGVAATVAVGTATHVLTSNGVGVAPTFQAAGGGGGFTPKAVMYVGSGGGAISSNTAWITVDLATEYYDDETNYSLSADIITVVDAGKYLISYTYTFHPTGGATNDSIKCRMTKNGTSSVLPGSTSQSLIYKANTRPSQVHCTFLASLAASDTVRLQQACESGTTGTELGTSINVSLLKVA
jgi:hypothetical protein